MTIVKEIQIQSIAEPAKIKIERGQKGGYGYEIELRGESLDNVSNALLVAKARLELELYGSVAKHNPDAHPE